MAMSVSKANCFLGQLSKITPSFTSFGRLFSKERKADVSGFTTDGIVPAPFTPFKNNGEIDFDKFDPYVDHLLEYGCKDLFVMGTTGEGLNMTVNERKSVAEKWIDARENKGLSKIILQIGAGNLKDSKELFLKNMLAENWKKKMKKEKAEHAHSIGADAISCVAPSYYRPQTEEQLVEYMKKVAGAAPSIPFYLYDIDFMTNVKLNMERFFDIAQDAIPTLCGIKYSSPDLPGLARCLRHADGRWHVMIGTDEQYLMGLALGAYTSVPTSYFTPMQSRMRQSFLKGDMEAARKEQDRCMLVSKIRAKYGSGPGLFSVTRSILPMLGIDIGPPRLPLTSPPPQIRNQLQKDLKQIGFFEWVK